MKNISNVSNVLTAVVSRLKKHVYWKNEGDYFLVALWILGTHIYDGFPKFPFLYVTGDKGAGKSTRLGESIKRLSREGIFTSSITKSALFRTVDELHPTMILDEQEHMRPRNN